MFQIDTFIEARLASVTMRIEKHGDEDKPACSLGLEITASNTLLDLIDPKLRHAIYMAKPDSEPELPEMEQVTPILRCNAFKRFMLTAKYEGWTLHIDDGVDESQSLVFGSAKVDKFSVDAKQGGSIVLSTRVGTSDLDAEKSGMLGMHVGQAIWIKLIAPKPKAEAIDGSASGGGPGFEGKQPDAGDMFADQHGGDDYSNADDEDDDGPLDSDSAGSAFDGTDGDDQVDDGAPEDKTYDERMAAGEPAWPFPRAANRQVEATPQSVTIERSQPGTRTVRGREKTREHILANASKIPAKYRNEKTGETWSGRGLQPKWLKVAIERGATLKDFEVGVAA